MKNWPRAFPTRTARHLIMVLGGLYIVFAALRGISVVAAGARLPGQLLNFGLVSLPSLALIYTSYQLPRTDIQPALYPRILGWTLLGGGVMVTVILVIAVTPGGGLEYLRLAGLLFGALGSLGGFGIGFQQATAITRLQESEQQAERLESFAGMLAHELRNPLQIAQLYLQQATTGDEQAFDQVEQAHTRIEEIIDILLVTARGTAADIDREPVALADVANEAWAEVAPDSAELVIETDRVVRADRIHLRHIFRNLFENAIEHGGENVTVWVSDLEEGDGFFIADDGPGIPATDQNRVFDAGYTTQSNGTGLGLAIVGQLIDAYGWDCTISESKAGGARFECRDVDLVTLPELGNVNGTG